MRVLYCQFSACAHPLHAHIPKNILSHKILYVTRAASFLLAPPKKPRPSPPLVRHDPARQQPGQVRLAGARVLNEGQGQGLLPAPPSPVCGVGRARGARGALGLVASSSSHSKQKREAPLQDAKGSKGKKLAPVDKPQLTQTEDILNSILPPRCARAHCSGCVRLLRPGAALFYEAAAEAFCPSSPLHATGAVARDPEAPFSFVAGRDRR